MAGAGESLELPRVEGARVLIVEARYYAGINAMLVEGAKAALARAGVAVEHVVVPGRR